MLKILGRANSFNVRKVLWICDELGIAHEREDWGRGYTPTSSPEFLEINPIGLIPAVIDDGVVLRSRGGADHPRDQPEVRGEAVVEAVHYVPQEAA